MKTKTKLNVIRTRKGKTTVINVYSDEEMDQMTWINKMKQAYYLKTDGWI